MSLAPGMSGNTPRWNEVTALFGGTFDPPHLGHREAVRGLFKVPGVRHVRVIPAATPPHKSDSTPAHHRLEMARLNFLSSPPDPYPREVTIDPLEIDRARVKSGPSYSFDTIQELARIAQPLAFVVGTDQLNDLHKWHRFPEILGLCHWLVLGRRPDGSEQARLTLGEWAGSGLIRPTTRPSVFTIASAGTAGPRYLEVVPTEAPELSSTRIRQALALKGEPPSEALTPEVSAYLKEMRLYGTQSAKRDSRS